MIHEDLREQLKTALKAKDAVALRSIRGLLTALTNEAVATGGTPQTILHDEKVIAVVKRMVKQRKDSIEQFRAGGREDLIPVEAEEMAYLEKYLPQMMSREEIIPIAEAKKAALGVDDKAKLGMLVGAVMKELAGRADGADVKSVVEQLFT